MERGYVAEDFAFYLYGLDLVSDSESEIEIYVDGLQIAFLSWNLFEFVLSVVGVKNE